MIYYDPRGGQSLPLDSNNAVLYGIWEHFETSKSIQKSVLWI